MEKHHQENQNIRIQLKHQELDQIIIDQELPVVVVEVEEEEVAVVVAVAVAQLAET